jgi:hypothetical protein
MSALAASMGNARGRLRDRGDDVFETPPAPVEALLSVETLPAHVWEPCCGSGRIAKVLTRHGHRVTASDLRGDRIDFLMEWRAPDGVEAVVTNPPYKLAADFVRDGLALTPMVVMLLRLNFLESAARSDLIDGGRQARVHVFADLLPRIHRQGWQGPLSSSTAAFAWFVWLREHAGPIVLDRITSRGRATP